MHLHRTLSVVALALIACTPPPPPAPAPAAPPVAPPPAPPAVPPEPALHVLLRPTREPSPRVHVEVDLDSLQGSLIEWTVSRGAADQIVLVAAQDGAGAIGARVGGNGDGVRLTLDRAPSGHVRVIYDVLATEGGPSEPGAVVVRGERFRGLGERLIALPPSVEDSVVPVTLDIDVAPLEADKAASSLGVGRHRTARLRPRALRYAAFLAGSHDELVIDTIDGHDEASWLGVAAFDLRETVVELAQERTILAGVLGGRSLLPDIPWTYLFEVSSQTAPGAFVITPRVDSMFIQLGSSESMTVPLRILLARPLARRWIGDAIRLAPDGQHPELGWFDDGVAQYLSLRALARIGVLGPDDWAGVIASELSVLATSGDVGKSNAEVAARVATDPEARTVLMMRGALYAARESAVIAARTKGARGMETLLAALLDRARPVHFGPYAPLSPSVWLELLEKEDPEAPKSFAAMLAGGPVNLPEGALGPCFRARAGEYVAFDPGFDLDATRRDKNHHVVSLRNDGPAAKSGLRADDIVQGLVAHEGDSSSAIKVSVLRGAKTTELSFIPRGRRGKGQVWSRVPGIKDGQCGLPP